MAAGAHKAVILDVLSVSLTYGVQETIKNRVDDNHWVVWIETGEYGLHQGHWTAIYGRSGLPRKCGGLRWQCHNFNALVHIFQCLSVGESCFIRGDVRSS